MKCSKCGKEVEENDIYCTSCGRKIKKDVIKIKFWQAITLIIIFISIFAGIIFFVRPNKDFIDYHQNIIEKYEQGLFKQDNKTFNFTESELVNFLIDNTTYNYLDNGYSKNKSDNTVIYSNKTEIGTKEVSITTLNDNVKAFSFTYRFPNGLSTKLKSQEKTIQLFKGECVLYYYETGKIYKELTDIEKTDFNQRFQTSIVNNTYNEVLNYNVEEDGTSVTTTFSIKELSEKSQEFKNAINVLQGYTGLGIKMKQKDNGDTFVYSIYDISSAADVGMKIGDVIISIDNIGINGKELSDISSMLKGNEGDYKKIRVNRNGTELDFNLTIGECRYITKSKIIEGNVGYISIKAFYKNCSAEIINIINNYTNTGINKLIFDLRDCNDGLLDESLNLLNFILNKENILLYKRFEDGKEQKVYSSGEKELDANIVILTNSCTDGIPELFVASLKENEKAKIVGITTKGSNPSLTKVQDNNELLTYEWLTPNKTNIKGKGIEPDYYVENSNNDDLQLKKAIELLK